MSVVSVLGALTREHVVGAGLLVATVLVARVVAIVARIYLQPGASARQIASYGRAGPDDKTPVYAVITGASDGIGAAWARELARRGYRVILLARTESKLHAVAADCRAALTQQGLSDAANAAHPLAVVRPFDFSTRDDALWQALASDLAAYRIGVLINNVGVSTDMPTAFLEDKMSDLERILDVNCLAQVRMTRIIAPGMAARHAADARVRSVIVNMGSGSSESPIPLIATYGASKAFLKAWSVSTSFELAPLGIDMQLYMTFFVQSAMSKISRTSWNVPSPDTYVSYAIRRLGCGPFQTPYPAHALMHQLIYASLPTMLMGRLSHGVTAKLRESALRKQARQNKSE
ncbi:hypothetical protein CXG81DRAFT_15058 [Caulochytrium protostelioides]|uniref:NAD(P)-binding protein n=1 Tax=Caulochytrium protostelioides TaxID=1555241 RepID=A0A4P9WWW6_9FUNG|nr:NAD(P)-binding protein [Caulochytrium protostelioides]RKO99077.1 hypothetical protein CXG81DRAFT_15058 [Caulochytrium protostelioides]|eukprot:RKO99077.1 hypothetical protein CXG81DRAFT_15058 [Caulochytrium protostelioides]